MNMSGTTSGGSRTKLNGVGTNPNDRSGTPQESSASTLWFGNARNGPGNNLDGPAPTRMGSIPTLMGTTPDGPAPTQMARHQPEQARHKS